MPNMNPLPLFTLDGRIGVRLNGEEGQSGYSVASAGDVNGDGFNDVLVGALFASNGNLTQAGITYLVFGHIGDWNSTFELGNLNGVNGVVIQGVAANDLSGWSVAGAFDVNGDGFGDVLIGAPGVLNGAGAVYLVFGHQGAWSSPLELGSLNGTNGVVINGIAAGDTSGWSVASAFDVNGDNIADVLIGAPGVLNGAGATYLIFGNRGAWSSPLTLASLNGMNGVVINGITAGDSSGYSVSASDVNGDNITDVLTGAPQVSLGGSTYIIFGHPGTWNGTLMLSNLNGTNGVTMNGVAAGDQSGYSVAGALDANGDGFKDVLIGAPAASETYLIFGHPGTWNSTLMLSNLNGTNGVTINGIGANEQSGTSVASAFDVNGDGIDDVLIGAPGGISPGSAYLIFGHGGTWGSSMALASLNETEGFVIKGVVKFDETGISVAGVGDVNGDGLGDMLIGAWQAAPQGISLAGSSYLIFGDTLNLLINNILTISLGQTVFFNNSMLAATRPYHRGLNTTIFFSISNVVHGTFSTYTFNQSMLSENLVSFTHDGSINAPSYEVTIGNWARVGPTAATVYFNILPVLYLNPFFVAQGETIVLTNQSIRASSVYHAADGLIFRVSNVLNGKFVQTNTTIPKDQFNQSVLNQGQIAFATDGSANVPSYKITVSDGSVTTSAVPGIVIFNAAPVFLNNQLTLTPGKQRVTLSSNDLSVSDASIPASDLILTPSTINCHFENLNLPGTALSLFLQKNVESNQIVFVWDGHTTPAYNMSANDGSLITNDPAFIIVTSSNVTSVSNTESTNINAIVGSIVAAVTLILLFLGLQRYWKKQTNKQFQKILLEAASEADKDFNEDVVLPIANKIFEAINTTGCLGKRSEVDNQTYMVAIRKIVSELRRLNANLDFKTMDTNDKEDFLKEIAKQTRQQSVPKRKGYACFKSCTRYFKAEVTPEEIDYVAEGIAKAAFEWQMKHMSVVDAQSTHRGEQKLPSDIAFSGVAANEDIPPDQRLIWMKNRVLIQQEKQELQALEEKVAKQAAELAMLKAERSGSKVKVFV